MTLLHPNDVVRDESNRSYRVVRRLGEGQFAEVWEVRLREQGTDLHYALKLEKRKDRNTVRQEYKVLKKLGLSGVCNQVVAVEGCGMHAERFFMVLQLAGETLYDARKAALGRLDLPTAKAVGLSTLKAIQQLHEQHWIHRDIKPANFVIDPPNAAAGKGSWLLIDFGLARRYTDEGGAHLPQRSDASFRGSTTYASVHAHKDEDLSRRDDLWSWLYMLVELVEGGLPWRLDKDGGEQHAQGDKDKHWVQQQKELCITDPTKLTRTTQLPEALGAISKYLAGLSFAAAPDYDHLRQCLQLLPDYQQQPLRLPGHLQQQLQEQEQDGQQWGSVLFDQQQQQQQQLVQQGLGQPGEWQQQWADPALAVPNGQQQQEQVQLSPVSPPREHLPPADATPGAAAAKRPPPGPAADAEQLAKQRRAEPAAGSQQRKPGIFSQQQQQRQGSTPQRSPAEDVAADGSTRCPRQGSTGARQAASKPANTQHAAQRQASRHDSQRSRSRSRERQQQQQQQQQDRGSSQDRGRAREPAEAAKSRPVNSSDRGGSGRGTAGSAAEVGASGRAAGAGPAKRQAAAAAAAVNVGSADEIADLVAAFNEEATPDSRDAVQQVVEQLFALQLQPVQATVAIAKILDSLADRTARGNEEAAAQLLEDVGEYARRAAARARRTRASLQ